MTIQVEESYQKRIDYARKYIVENPSKHTAYVRKWIEKNREKVNKYQREYYQANKDKFHEKIMCHVCGGTFTRQSKAVHLKTKKHIRCLSLAMVVQPSVQLNKSENSDEDTLRI